MDVRHPSFMDPTYLALARAHGVATVFTDSSEYPSFADLTADFVYARLMGCESGHPTGYPPERLARWADAARLWRAGDEPAELPHVEVKGGAAGLSAPSGQTAERDVFMFFISGAKERAPAAAMALLQQLEDSA